MAGLVINHNLMSMTAARNLTNTYGKLGTAINRLSSGLRITSSKDDAAGLAVRELMRSDIAVINQGIRNANDAISMLQTMDGAAQVIDEKLIRMKELSEQAATGTYSSDQRSIMNDEFSKMRDEIERIAQATDFNQVKMLNATSGGTAQVITLTGNVAAIGATESAANLFTDFNTSDMITIRFTDTTGTVTYASIGGNELVSTLLSRIEAQSFIDTANTSYSSVGGAGGVGMLTIESSAAGVSQIDIQLLQGEDDYDAAIATTGNDGQVKVHFGTGNNSAEDYYYANKQDMTSSGLGVNSLSISTQASAQAALETIDTAITSKDTARAHFGALMNRLSNTVSNLSVQAENIQAAESQISDADIAIEMTAFVNNQIKAQAAVAMLAQANMMPQMALSLLGG